MNDSTGRGPSETRSFGPYKWVSVWAEALDIFQHKTALKFAPSKGPILIEKCIKNSIKIAIKIGPFEGHF